MLARKDLFDQQRVLCHRIGIVALSLAVPARDEGETMGDVLDLEPRRPEKHMAEFVFDKQLGREEPPNLDDDDISVG